MNPSRDKGTRAETAFCLYLADHYPTVERRTLKGCRDRGDVAGIPGVTVEVKAAKRAELGAWLRELDVEMVNDRSDIGFLAVKPIGKTQGKDYFIVCRPDVMLRLLKEAGR
jgi:hypothetical protein